MPYFNKETFISVMEGRKALPSFYVHGLQVSAFLWSMCNIIAMFYKSCKVVRIFPPLEANKTHLLVCQLVYFIVMLYLLLCSSHVAGMKSWSDQQNKRTEILQ